MHVLSLGTRVHVREPVGAAYIQPSMHACLIVGLTQDADESPKRLIRSECRRSATSGDGQRPDREAVSGEIHMGKHD
jgi:hypothetical protein